MRYGNKFFQPNGPVRSKHLSLADTCREDSCTPHRNDIYVILLLLFAGTLFPDSGRCQTESFEALPSLPSSVEDTDQMLARGGFDVSRPPPRVFERDASGGSTEQDKSGGAPQSQMQTQSQNHQGLAMRSVKRTLEDQKELYRALFKPSNFKWDALVLGGPTH